VNHPVIHPDEPDADTDGLVPMDGIEYEESDDVVAAAVLGRSVLLDGVCANATEASNAEAARPAVIYLTNMWFLPE